MTSSTSTTTFSRGDVVTVRWPDKYTQSIKARPALIIQSDTFSADDDTIVLISLTSDMTLPLLNCRIPIRMETPEQAAFNTRVDSLVLPEKVLHLPVSEVRRRIGRCPAVIMTESETSLRLVLDL